LAFAEEFANALEVSDMPSWVRGACDACQVPCVGALANCAWYGIKRWSRRHGDVDRAREVAARFAQRKV